jgi:hypothetical protein
MGFSDFLVGFFEIQEGMVWILRHEKPARMGFPDWWPVGEMVLFLADAVVFL